MMSHATPPKQDVHLLGLIISSLHSPRQHPVGPLFWPSSPFPIDPRPLGVRRTFTAHRNSYYQHRRIDDEEGTYHHGVSSSLNHQREVGAEEKRVWNLEMRFRRLTCPSSMLDCLVLPLMQVPGKVYLYRYFRYWYWRDWWHCYWYHYGIQVGLGAHEAL